MWRVWCLLQTLSLFTCHSKKHSAIFICSNFGLSVFPLTALFIFRLSFWKMLILAFNCIFGLFLVSFWFVCLCFGKFVFVQFMCCVWCEFLGCCFGVDTAGKLGGHLRHHLPEFVLLQAKNEKNKTIYNDVIVVTSSAADRLTDLTK